LLPDLLFLPYELAIVAQLRPQQRWSQCCPRDKTKHCDGSDRHAAVEMRKESTLEKSLTARASTKAKTLPVIVCLSSDALPEAVENRTVQPAAAA
jgi:hypothetical protein